MKNKAQLIEGNIQKTLIQMTIPMIAGILSMVVYNLVDTYFVGQLGKNELAALSFTFPVVLIINSIALGLGMGSSSVISRAIGKGDMDSVKRLTTDGLILAIVIVAFFVSIGLLTIKPIFTLLGASNTVLPFIYDYMRIWYLGMIFVVIPMVGNNVIRATGDTKIPGLIMLTGAIINTIMDPLLIFGIGHFPNLGVSGAALATVIGRASTFTVSLYVLIFKKKLVTFSFGSVKTTLKSWGNILYIGIPNALVKMIFPLGVGIITSLIAAYGETAVAGFGVASRIEFFSLAFVNALSSVFAPFTGQNWGANKLSRIEEGYKISEKFSIFSGLCISILLFIFAKPIAGIFNKDTTIINNIVLYIRIVPLAYTMQGIYLITSTGFNAINKPILATGLSLMEMFVLYIPLAYLGSKLYGLSGIFIALFSSYIITGILSHICFNRTIFSNKDKTASIEC